MTRMTVGGAEPYAVFVGPGSLEALDRLVPAGAGRVLLVTSPAVAGLARRVEEELGAVGRDVTRFEVPDGEDAKRLDVLARGWDACAQAGLTRQDAIVALGGGAVTDLAGFMAASYLRGIAVVHLPTTLLAMVDAAIGGKTGIDIAAGKNLVGAFHPPSGVACDLSALDTLPESEWRSGLAEVAKCGFIADPELTRALGALPPVEGEPTLVPDRGPGAGTIGAQLVARPAVLREVVERAIAVKADVVARDLREAGPREALNYGHTLGHAIERAEGYRVRHGEAIAVGMVFAAALAAAAGKAPFEAIGDQRAALTRLGLPVRYGRSTLPSLLATMALDKKSRGSRLRFVIVPEPGRTEILADPSPEALAAAAGEIGLPLGS